MSEVFNELVQNSSLWVRVFGEKTMGYPEHKEFIKKLRKKDFKNYDINDLTENIVKVVEEKQNLKISN